MYNKVRSMMNIKNKFIAKLFCLRSCSYNVLFEFFKKSWKDWSFIWLNPIRIGLFSKLRVVNILLRPHAKQLPNDLSKIPIKPAVYYRIDFSSSHFPNCHPKWKRALFEKFKAWTQKMDQKWADVYIYNGRKSLIVL